MKSRPKHIALFLAAIFAITIVPFNAFHHHEEEEHLEAMVSHAAHHSCELDEAFCQGEFTNNCGHEAHVHAPLVKCFICDFHFIKSFEHRVMEFNPSQMVFEFSFPSLHLAQYSKYSYKPNNKGPPVIFS